MTPDAGEGLGKRALLPSVGGGVCPRVFGELLGLLVKIISVYTLYSTSYSLTTYSTYTSGQIRVSLQHPITGQTTHVSTSREVRTMQPRSKIPCDRSLKPGSSLQGSVFTVNRRVTKVKRHVAS